METSFYTEFKQVGLVVQEEISFAPHLLLINSQQIKMVKHTHTHTKEKGIA